MKVKNVSKSSLQLKIWLTADHLKGQLLSNDKIIENFHIIEKNHLFIKRGDKYFRYNEILRETQVGDKIEKIEEINYNFAPVLYEVKSDYLKENNFEVLDCTSV